VSRGGGTPVTDGPDGRTAHSTRSLSDDSLKGIGNAVYYPVPLHLQPCFAYLGMAEGSLLVSERATREVMSIPVFPELTEAELEEVATVTEEFYA
jgi:dTDP-4-amino-4,6-dideoxygalactose transaminase